MAYVEFLLVLIYFVAIAFIFSYSLVQLDLLRLYMSIKKSALPKEEITEFPLVCIQLPVYNERYVVERLIDACSDLNYPPDLLEIQILDDSDDDTTSIIQEKLKTITDEVNIQHIRRSNRIGFKAGALEYGMQQSKAEFIAIFDADFLPNPEFLLQTIPRFSDANVAAVQTRWTHLNEDADWLTRLQAFGLNAHFTIEQQGRAAGGHFLNFNGTAGIWRKEAIERAGGWSDETLTEDLDLSYRAQLAGWRIEYAEEIESPAELPITMSALKSQQFRWTKGAAQCAVKHLSAVLRSQQISARTKIHATFHLMNSFVFLAILIASVLSIPLMMIRSRIEDSLVIDLFGTVFISSLLILSVYYFTAFRRSVRSENGKSSFLRLFLMFLSTSMGMSLHNSKAILEAYAGVRSSFIRTPKFNLQIQSGWIENEYISPIAFREVLSETLLSLLFGVSVIVGVWIGELFFTLFHALLSIGFGTIAFSALTQNRAMAARYSTTNGTT